MIRIHFTAADFALVRFAARPAPLQELNVALMMMVSGDDGGLFGRWRRRVLQSLPSAVGPIRDLVPGREAPIFLDVFSDSLSLGFDTIRATPPGQVRSELERVYARTPVPAPSWIRDLHRNQGNAWKPLLRAQRAAFDTVLNPVWNQVQDGHQAEFTRYALTVAERGTAAALAALIPGTRLHEDVWELAGPDERDVKLQGRGLLLLPTFHWTGHPLISSRPGHPVVVTYPAGTGLPLSASETGDVEDALIGVLGRTRADILLLLADEHSTTDLARRLRVSNATASAQTGALRAAGLITTVRAGRAVVHRQTALGRLLIQRHRI
jgi:DNA-binding transcriptional ArsR family regulator